MIGLIVVYRFVALAAFYGLFWAWDWMPIRELLRNVIGWSVRVSGYSPTSFVYEGSPAIRIGDHVFFYTAECTYFDLLMIVAPFVWVFGASRRSNTLRIAIAVLVILGGNLIRTWASVYFNVRGTDWFYAHDLPDYILWWPTVMVVVLLALRRDFGGRSGSPQQAHSTKPTSEGTVDDACVQA